MYHPNMIVQSWGPAPRGSTTVVSFRLKDPGLLTSLRFRHRPDYRDEETQVVSVLRDARLDRRDDVVAVLEQQLEAMRPPWASDAPNLVVQHLVVGSVEWFCGQVSADRLWSMAWLLSSPGMEISSSRPAARIAIILPHVNVDLTLRNDGEPREFLFEIDTVTNQSVVDFR